MDGDNNMAKIPVYLCMNLNEIGSYQSKIKYLLVDLIEQTTSFDILGIFIEDSLNNTLVDSSMDFWSSEGYQKFAAFLPRKYSIELTRQTTGNYSILTFKQGNDTICTVNVYNNLSWMFRDTLDTISERHYTYTTILSDKYEKIKITENNSTRYENHPVTSCIMSLGFNTNSPRYYPIIVGDSFDIYSLYQNTIHSPLDISLSDIEPVYNFGYFTITKTSIWNTDSESFGPAVITTAAGMVGWRVLHEYTPVRYDFGIESIKFYTTDQRTPTDLSISSFLWSGNTPVLTKNYLYILGPSISCLKTYYHNTSIQRYADNIDRFIEPNTTQEEFTLYGLNFKTFDYDSDDIYGCWYYPYDTSTILKDILDVLRDNMGITQLSGIDHMYYLGDSNFFAYPNDEAPLRNLFFNRFNYNSYQKETLYIDGYHTTPSADLDEILQNCENFNDVNHDPEQSDKINYTVNNSFDSALLYWSPASLLSKSFIELLKSKFLSN